MATPIKIVLRSDLFRDNERLQRAASDHRHHLTLGDEGDHVRRLHVFLTFWANPPMMLQLGKIIGVKAWRSDEEVRSYWEQFQLETFYALYGPRTADLVRAFKTQADIVDRSRQRQADGIVGVRTIREMDDWAQIPRSRGGIAPDVREQQARSATPALKPLVMAGPVVGARMLRR